MGLLFDLLIQLDSIHPFPEFFIHWQMFPLVEGRNYWYQDPDDLLSGAGEMGYDDSDYMSKCEGTANTITLHHNHHSLCDGNRTIAPGLRVESEFISMVDKAPKTILKFIKKPVMHTAN